MKHINIRTENKNLFNSPSILNFMFKIKLNT